MARPNKVVGNASSRALRTRAKGRDANLASSSASTGTRAQAPKLTESERLLLRWNSDGLDINAISREWNSYMDKNFSIPTIKGKLTTALKKAERALSSTQAIEDAPGPDQKQSEPSTPASIDETLDLQTSGLDQGRSAENHNLRQEAAASEKRGNGDANLFTANNGAHVMSSEPELSHIESQSEVTSNSNLPSKVPVSEMGEQEDDDEEINRLILQSSASTPNSRSPKKGSRPQEASSGQEENREIAELDEHLRSPTRKRTFEQSSIGADRSSSNAKRSKSSKSRNDSPSSDSKRTKTKTLRRTRGKKAVRILEAVGGLTEDKLMPNKLSGPRSHYSQTTSSGATKADQKEDEAGPPEVLTDKNQSHAGQDAVHPPSPMDRAHPKRTFHTADLEPESSQSATSKKQRVGDHKLAAQPVNDHAPAMSKNHSKADSIAPNRPSNIKNRIRSQNTTFVVERDMRQGGLIITDPPTLSPQSPNHILGSTSTSTHPPVENETSGAPRKRHFRTPGAYFATCENNVHHISSFFDRSAEKIAKDFSKVSGRILLAVRVLFGWWAAEDVEEDRIKIARDVAYMKRGALEILTKETSIQARHLFLDMLDNKNGEPGPYGMKPLRGSEVACMIFGAMLQEEVYSQELAPKMGMPVMSEDLMGLLGFVSRRARDAARTDWNGYPPGKEAEALRYMWRDYRKDIMKGDVFQENVAALAEKILGSFERDMILISRDPDTGFHPRRRSELLAATKDAINFKCKLELYGSKYEFRWVAPCHTVFDRTKFMKAFGTEVSRQLPEMKLSEDSSHRVRYALTPALFEQRFVGQNRPGMEARERDRRIALLKAAGNGDDLGDAGFRPAVCLRPAHVMLFDGVVMEEGDDRGKKFYPEDEQSTASRFW